MPTIKIGDLPSIVSLNSSDVLPTVDKGANPGSPTTYKITVKNLADSLTQVSSSISASYVTGSLFTSKNPVLSASYALSSSYANNGGVTSIIAGTGISINASTGNVTITSTGGGGSSFPYTGSAQITGSLGVTGSVTATDGGFTGSLFGTSSVSLRSQAIAMAGDLKVALLNLAGVNPGNSQIGFDNGATFTYDTTTKTLNATASRATSSSYAISSSYAVTSSYVLSSSYATTASYVNPLNQNVTITGSLIISGSPSPEIRVIGEMTITGSLIISGSSALRVFNSASIFSGSLSVGNISPSTTVGRIDASNDIVAYSTSDSRLKTQVSNISDPITKINMINGVNFTWIENPEVHGNSGRDVGVIAQELEAVLPEVVTTRESGYKAVKYEKIVPLLIEAIKDLQKQIDELKAGK